MFACYIVRRKNYWKSKDDEVFLCRCSPAKRLLATNLDQIKLQLKNLQEEKG